MAKLKTLKLKDKKYIFKAYENNKLANPAYVVFSRFPADFEEYFSGEREYLFDALDNIDVKTEDGRKKFVDLFIERYIENIKAGRVDYGRFLENCVGSFGDFEYDGKKIKTVGDFLSLPEAAVRKISAELYAYAQSEDKFSMGE